MAFKYVIKMKLNISRRSIAIFLVLAIWGTLIYPPDGTVVKASTSLEDEIIDGEQELMNSDLVCTGNGTENDPYLIEDVEMGSHDLVLRNISSYLVLSNISFSASQDTAITLYNVSSIRIVDCSSFERNSFLKSEECTTVVIEGADVDGIDERKQICYLSSTSEIYIEDSRFNSSATYGSSLYADRSSVIRSIENCSLSRIPVISSGWDEDCEVAHNEFKHSSLKMTISEGGIGIHNNSFSGYVRQLTLDTEYPALIHHNLFQGGFGITISSANPVGDEYGRIENNVFRNCSRGIQAWGMHSNEFSMDHWDISDNYFGNITNNAILLRHGTHNVIHRNIFENIGPDGEEVYMNPYDPEGQHNVLSKNGVGNYWSDHTSFDLDMDGIVDEPKEFDGGYSDEYPVTNRKFDLEGPVIDLKDPIPAVSRSNYLFMEFEIDDNLSDVARSNLSLDGTEMMNITGRDRASLSMENGNHIVTISAVDTSGVGSSLSAPIEVLSPSGILTVEDPFTGDYTNEQVHELDWEVDNSLVDLHQQIEVNGEPAALDKESRSCEIELREGPNLIELAIDDGVDVRRTWTREIICDTIRPDARFTGPLDGVTISNRLARVSWNVTDANGPLSVELSIDGGDWETVEGTSGLDVFLEDGSHRADIIATDPAGNVDKETIRFHVGKPPELVIISPVNGTHTNSRDLEVNWEYTGNLSLSRSQIRVGKDGVLEELQGGVHPVRLGGDSEDTMDKSFDILIRLTLDDENRLERTVTVVLDRKSPKVLFKETEGHPYVNQSSYPLEWNILDADEEVQCSLSLDEEDLGPMDPRGNIESDLADGWHTYVLEAVDRAGNKMTDEHRIYVDTDHPDVVIERPLHDTVLVKSLVAISWSADDESGITTTSMVVDGSGTEYIDPKGSVDKYFHDDGVHTISVTAEDICGNKGETTVSFMLDLEEPYFVTEPEVKEMYNTSQIPFVWEVADSSGISEVVLSVDGSKRELDRQGSIEIELEPGEHVLHLSVVDLAERKTEREWTVVCDPDAPIIMVDEDIIIGEDGSARITWSVSDSVSGVERDTTLVSVDGGPWVPSASDNSYSTGPLKPGAHMISIKCQDQAGNSVLKTVEFEVGKTDAEVSEEEEGPGAIIIAAASVPIILIGAAVGIMLYLRSKREEETKVEEEEIPSPEKKLQVKALPAPRTEQGYSDVGSEYIRPSGGTKEK